MRGGAAKTILSGYYKYGVQTLLLGDFGTTGTIVLDVYEDDGRENTENTVSEGETE